MYLRISNCFVLYRIVHFAKRAEQVLVVGLSNAKSRFTCRVPKTLVVRMNLPKNIDRIVTYILMQTLITHPKFTMQ